MMKLLESLSFLFLLLFTVLASGPTLAISDLRSPIEFDRRMGDEEARELLTRLEKRSEQLFEEQKYAECESVCDSLLDLQKTHFGELTPKFLSYLESATTCHLAQNRGATASHLAEKYFEIAGKMMLSETDAFRAMLLSASYGQSMAGDFGKAREYGEKAYKLTRRLNPADHKKLAAEARYMADLYRKLERYDQSMLWEVRACQDMDNAGLKKYDTESAIIKDAKKYIAEIKYRSVDPSQLPTALLSDTVIQNFDCWHKEMGLISTCFGYDGNSWQAVAVDRRIIAELEKRGASADIFIHHLTRMSANLDEISEYDEALQVIIRAEDLATEHQLESLGVILSNRATYLGHLGRHMESIELGVKALETLKSDMHDADYLITTLNNIASQYAELNNYEQAIKYTEQILDIPELEKSTHFGTILCNIADYYRHIPGQKEKAMQYARQSAAIIREKKGTRHADYARALNEIMHIEDPPAIKKIDKISEIQLILEASVGTRHPLYADMILEYADVWHELGYGSQAIECAEEALDIYTEALGRDHPSCKHALLNLLIYALQSKDEQAGNRYFKEAADMVAAQSLIAFSSLTSAERSRFWDIHRYWYSDWMPAIAVWLNTPQAAEIAYNGMLLSKGMLLNADAELIRLISESGDIESQLLLNELYELRADYDRRINAGVSSPASLASLKEKTEECERRLLARSKDYGDYTRRLALDWRTVANALVPGEVAIEFMSFPDEKDVYYYALSLKPGGQVPKLTPLFSGKELAGIATKNLYTTPQCSNLVWAPLAEELEGAKKVYFSASGQLHNIAIESLPDFEKDGLIENRADFIRLSSTRQVLQPRGCSPFNSGVLYGGLAYDSDINSLRESQRSFTQNTAKNPSHITRETLNLRVGAGPHPGTRSEVDSIFGKLTHMQGSNFRIFTDNNGTEASFKSLSGNRNGLLHLATHGFYWNEIEAEVNNDMSFLREGYSKVNDAAAKEDRALSRSGLLFAGANLILNGRELPPDIDDGVLTAREIAALDLRGLEMVVLSACQTGLGEINGEGVFGLQRGFKKAGASTLLMSLWKVDDEATSLLMTTFYDSLLSGCDKLASLRCAQKKVRQYTLPDGTHPYEHPRYWASFILLDAV